jgi:hypothetical protein
MDLKTAAWLDQEDARITAMIRRYGWVITYVSPSSGDGTGPAGAGLGGPSFAYTTGLFGLGHAELLVFGVCPHVAGVVLDAVAGRVRAGENLVPGQPVEVGGCPFIPEEVPNSGQILFDANRFYARPQRHPVPALQLSYPDDDGRYPWEPGFAEPDRQPRPGTFRA